MERLKHVSCLFPLPLSKFIVLLITPGATGLKSLLPIFLLSFDTETSDVRLTGLSLSLWNKDIGVPSFFIVIDYNAKRVNQCSNYIESLPYTPR